MGLSQDPEKRAKQEAALRKGNPRAFSKPRESAGAGGERQAQPGAAQPASTGTRTVRARAPQQRSQAKPRSRPSQAKPASASRQSQAKPRKEGFLDGLFGGI
jgi:hypothetical protein